MPTRWKRQKIAAEFGFSNHFLDKVVAGLRKYKDRYPNGVISSGHVTVIDVEMMCDWIKFRDALDKGLKFVPPFNREDYQ